MKSREVCNKTQSTPASLLLKDQGAEHPNMIWAVSIGESGCLHCGSKSDKVTPKNKHFERLVPVTCA